MTEPMDPETWRRIKHVLDQAAENPQDQSRILEEACAGDPKLLADVQRFLEHEDAAETFIDEPLWHALPEMSENGEEAPAIPKRLGPYRLVRRLGHGGMGEVFLATREDDYEQKVALKRILGPALQNGLQERFVRERQILADLQHPGIARLLDGGTDDHGLPYLVMEYVEGSPIDVYCDDQQLTSRQRLRLVSKVCRIVHDAHKNLVVHRDLKPSNIMVAPDGRPRLLDFGIAKVLHPDAAATAKGGALMTPACAAPEQIMGDPITTACDVYALGVLLYRLLTGLPPYDIEDLSFSAMCGVICLHDVTKPSIAVLERGTASRRHPDSAPPPANAEGAVAPEKPSPPPESRSARRRLSQTLRGDLDAIVMKALRKEARHRFASAAEMADDIDRYLDGMPVVARKGDWLYHAQKYMRRHKSLVALMVMILALALISSIFGWQAEIARRGAVEAQLESESLRDILIDILQSPAPEEAKGRDRTVREVIEEAQPRIETTLASQPRLQAQMFDILGAVFNQLGDPDKALELHQRAFDIERARDPAPRVALADYIANVGSAHYALRDYAHAEASYRQALELRERADDDALAIAQTLRNLTNVRMQRGESVGIEEAYRRILDLRRQHETDHGKIAESLYSLAAWLMRCGRDAEAVPLLEEGLELTRTRDQEPSLIATSIAKSLARAYHATGKTREARALYDDALATWQLLFGPDDVKVGSLKQHLARLLLDLGEIEAATGLAREALDNALRQSPDHDRVTVARSVLAACLLAPRGSPEESAVAELEAGERLLVELVGHEAFITRWTRRQIDQHSH